MAENVNQLFFDAVVRHQIYLMRFSGSVQKRIVELLNKTEDDIKCRILTKLKNVDPNTTTGQARLNVLLEYIRTARGSTWNNVRDEWVTQLTELAKKEPEFIDKQFKTVSPVILDTVLPTAETIRSLVTSRPFQGRILKDWAKSIQAVDLQRIEDQIKIGLMQGETVEQIARRVFGTGNLDGIDGVTEITRQQSKAITRTAVNHVGNQAKREYYKANSDLFREELYVATLDSRTTAVCKANDGKRFPVGEGPIPPLHYNCRSLRVAIINDEVIGTRPAKPTVERELVEDFAKENELEPVRKRDDLPPGWKTKYDAYARKRIRQLTEQRPAEESYNVWLRRQSKTFQEEVLGVTKAKLYRDGKLSLDRFVNRQGDELTLAQLARREAAAFRAAGLDPEDYK
jgi:SPP1 gp7 family putative phage head morphogenesis protein